MRTGRVTPSPTSPAPSRSPSPRDSSPRQLSLDAFRGITIAAMLLVNNPGTWGAVYPPLRHAEWNGWTPTDLIFPFFLFIVGVSMSYSLVRRLEAGAGKGALLGKAARRSLILFGLGLMLNGFPDYWNLADLRIPGVLQRIALAYFVATLILLFTSRRGQAAVAAVLLGGYWWLLTRVPLPGGAAPSLEPGRDLGAWIDRTVFGEAHLWASSRTWDPEGLLSTLPAVATVLTGLFAGYVLRGGDSRVRTTMKLAGMGVLLTLAGLVWDRWFPINKNLWTSSYVLFTSGLGVLGLTLCWLVIDVWKRRHWAMPFVAFGMNAIAAFVLSGLFARLLGLVRVPSADGGMSLKAALYGLLSARVASPELGSLLFAVAFVLFWIAVMWGMYRRKIFFKV